MKTIKTSIIFEGKNSSLRKAYEASVKKSEKFINQLIKGRRDKNDKR